MSRSTSRDLLAGLSPEKRAVQEKAIALHKSQAKPGLRIAMVCPDEKCNPRWRHFYVSEADAAFARCPDHGRAVRQGNRPYFDAAL